jgi:glycine cleavage system aminomethyltransferase T
MTADPPPRLTIDGRSIGFSHGDTVLVALLRNGLHPTGGGCLCLAGDCPHCLATVDGVSYVRTCQVTAHSGMVVDGHPRREHPPLPVEDRSTQPAVARHLFCDVVVIGSGDAGQAEAAAHEGRRVITLDAAAGQEVVGIYPGPLVVARTATGMLHVHPRDEIIVATGAAEIQPVAPGNHLAGLVTARAASRLQAAGIDLGRVVAIGTPPPGVDATHSDGDLIRFVGDDGPNARVRAVIVRGHTGVEQQIPCDTVSLGLGWQARDSLLRMGAGLNVRAVGSAARRCDAPPCPTAGLVCHCCDVTVDDLKSAHARGFQELELIKRATLAGTGACQGATCVPHVRSLLASGGRPLPAPFTARPLTRQVTFIEAAAGAHHGATPRTALDDEHRRAGATMDRLGGWWRPWTYGDALGEYWAVRKAVSLGDVSTLGKMRVSGPGALELLERLYPTKVSTIAPGRARYALLLDDRGYVLDDGMICRETDTRFALTFTSGGSTTAEMWVRDWAEAWGLDVRILNQTMSLSAINVTGPRATELLARAGLESPPKHLHHLKTEVAGVPCHVFRLSFTGEVSYELHHPAAQSVTLWRRLLDLGADLGCRPHGLETLLRLRLEKGHIVVGQDTDFDSTPRRINHEWAVKLDKPDFVGRQALVRTSKVPLDRQLVGLEMDGAAPPEGALIWSGEAHAGYVTSCTFSPALGRTVMLGWLALSGGRLPDDVTIDGRRARRAPTPFYDPEGARLRV